MSVDRHELVLWAEREGEVILMATGGLGIWRIIIAGPVPSYRTPACANPFALQPDRKAMGKRFVSTKAIQLKLGALATKTRAAELLWNARRARI